MTSAFADLSDRIEALQRVIEVGGSLVPAEAADQAKATVAHAATRLRHGSEFTVVALAGATGSGKSTIFNALVGEPIAPAGLTRPTTAEARAAVFGRGDTGALLDWLGIKHRHGIGGQPELDGLVLIDLPDHDSVEVSHRLQVDHFVANVDLLIWVLDPQKYADQVLHDRYLAPLSTHGDSMAFLLHQADRLTVADHATWEADAHRLLALDGLAAPTILITSATTGLGIDDLRQLLAERIANRQAALARIDADLKAAAEALEALRKGPRKAKASKAERQNLAAGLADAAGAPLVRQAVADGFRHDAALATGWPFTRWIKKFRRHPLRRLRPPSSSQSAARPTAPGAVPIDAPRLDLALKTYADAQSADSPPMWARSVRAAADSRRSELEPEMGNRILGVAAASVAAPRWWGVFAWLQRLLATTVAAGAIWLIVLLVLDWLRVPADRLTPEVGGWPVPTLLLLGGAALGLMFATVARGLAAVGAKRRARRADKAITAAIDAVSERLVVAPVAAELARWGELARLVDIVAGRSK